MLCPRCGKPTPPGAAFCPACGLAFAPTAPRPTATRVPAAHSAVATDFEAQKRRNATILAGVAVAAVVAGLVGAGAYLRLGASSPKPVLQARAATPPAALQIPAHADPAPLQVGATQKTMPADVRAWLEHLEEVEKRKVKIASDQNADAMVLAQRMQALGPGMSMLNGAGEIDPGSDDNKDPGAYAKDKVQDFRPPWDALAAFFNSKQPPAECLPLAAAYNHGLSEIGGMMGDLGSLLNSVSQDPASALKKANALQGKSPEAIDRYFGDADDKLGAICAEYDTKKWFDVKKDVGAGGMLGLPGNLGGGGGLGGAGLGQ